MAKTFTAPGPGAYALKGVIGREGPASTMHSKIENGSFGKAKNVPGPGQYDLSLV